MTYCVNRECPFEDCEKHLWNVKTVREMYEVYVADFDKTCRRYISWLAEEVQNERHET